MNTNKNTYTTPSMVEFGSVIELTKGSGTSSTWDMGSGKKKGCSCSCCKPVY